MIQELQRSVKELQSLGLKPSQIDALSRHFITIRDCTLSDWDELSKMFEWNKPITSKVIREELLQPTSPSPPKPRFPSRIEDVERKWCKGCKQLLPKTDFGKNNIEKDHLMRKCKKCLHDAKYKLPTGEITVPYVPRPVQPRGVAMDVIREKILKLPELPTGKPETWTRGNSLTIGMIAYRVKAQGGVVGRVLSQLEKEGKVGKEFIPSLQINGRDTNATVYWKIEEVANE
jgi:hypothetical protein